MTEAQEAHLKRIITEFSGACSAKYRRGQAEHGGILCEVPAAVLLDAAIEEAIDQVVYLLTLREQIGVTLEHARASTPRAAGVQLRAFGSRLPE